MGDLRSTWRDVVEPLVAAGHRVAVTDLRGHGDGETTFRRYGDVATGEDLLALVRELGDEPAVLIGNSMGASASVWAAAERPDRVAGLRASLRRPGYLRAFRRLAVQLTHAPVEAWLAEVRAPAVAFIGELDPDFADPAAELAWIVATLGARGVGVPDAAHYPQHRTPAAVLARVPLAGRCRCLARG